MIRSAMPERIICFINTLRGDLNSHHTFAGLFLAGTLTSYFLLSPTLGGTFVSYFLVSLFLSAAIVQEDLRSFLSGEAGAELGHLEPFEKREGIGVALYLRVSTDRQAEKGFSLQDQEERLMGEARERLKATRIYKIVDAGESGTDFTRRGLNEILELAREGKIQYVLVTSLDRIGRDLIESLDYVRKLCNLGVKIVAAGAEADIATEEGLMKATIELLWAELDNKKRTRNSIAGRIQSFKARHWGRSVPKGYRKREDSWIEKEAGWGPVIKDIFDFFLRKRNYQAVRKLIDKKYQDVLPTPLTRHHITRILRDCVYAGRPEYAGKVTVEDPNLVYVDSETFEKAQKLAGLIHRRYSRKRKDTLKDLVKEYGPDVLEFIPNIAVLCPNCQGAMVKNGSPESIGEWTIHNYLCRKDGTQRRVPTKRQMRKIQEWASKQTKLSQKEGLNTKIGK